MSLRAAELNLLSDHDDDFYGLWEVDWYFNRERPEWSHDERATFLSGLVERNLIDVFHGRLMTRTPPLASHEALQALGKRASWAPPVDGQEVGYFITTSEAGLAAVRLQTRPVLEVFPVPEAGKHKADRSASE